FFCKQMTAYEFFTCLECRRVLFRSPEVQPAATGRAVGRAGGGASPLPGTCLACRYWGPPGCGGCGHPDPPGPGGCGDRTRTCRAPGTAGTGARRVLGAAGNRARRVLEGAGADPRP